MTTVECDTRDCGYSFETDMNTALKYFNKKCPNCGNKTLISFADLIMGYFCLFLMSIGFCTEIKSEADRAEYPVILEVDTTSLNRKRGN